jgi:hypothetical protein
MNSFFIIIELLTYVFALYCIVKKKDLCILYLPLVHFVNQVITSALPTSIFYAICSMMLLRCCLANISFFRRNIFALCLLLYTCFLMTKSSDLTAIRPALFAVFWFFLSLPLLNSMYIKRDRSEIYKELVQSSLLILIVFTLNVFFSSVTNYNPYAQYGITRGVLYGNIYATNFNILPVALFIVLHSIMHQKKKLLSIAVLILSVGFIILSLRRTVIGLSLAAIIACFIILLRRETIIKFLSFITVGSVLIGFIVVNTPFYETFMERYELRKLDDRQLEEEGRFMEYQFVLNDFFKYEHYSPWFGYELLNSHGNYGRGSIDRDRLAVFEERSLHSDIPNIAHSSGLIGLALYVLMIITAFRNAYRGITDRETLIFFLFSLMTFLVFTTTGRYIEAGAMILLFSILYLPLAKGEETEIFTIINKQKNG